MSEKANRCLSSNKTECIDVHIRLPKPIVDFVEALAEFCRIDLQEFWQQLIVDITRTYVKEMDGPYVDTESVIERFALKEVFDRSSQ